MGSLGEEVLHLYDQEQVPLLGYSKPNTVAPIVFKIDSNLVQMVIGKTFRNTANLSNLLPTGTVLSFRLLSPVFTNEGECNKARNSMTEVLVTLFALACFVSSFTDSFRDDEGTVRHGIATIRGLWVIDGPPDCITPEKASEFRLTMVDFLHALVSALVFFGVALLDQNVVNCFYPSPSESTRQLLSAMPFGFGLLGTICFIIFPTTRHGIGFPLSLR